MVVASLMRCSCCCRRGLQEVSLITALILPYSRVNDPFSFLDDQFQILKNIRSIHIMATEEKAEGSQQVDGGDPAIGFAGKVEAKYRELKENAEKYPYVWAAYAIVYGSFGLWTLYRFRKLRKTEDRVRALQERLRQLVQEEEAAASAASKSATSVDSASTPAHVSKTPK